MSLEPESEPEPEPEPEEKYVVSYKMSFPPSGTENSRVENKNFISNVHTAGTYTHQIYTKVCILMNKFRMLTTMTQDMTNIQTDAQKKTPD